MTNTAQKRAMKNRVRRVRKRGIARFEVLGLESDRHLIRSLAKRLAQNDPDTNRIRMEVMRTVSHTPKEEKIGILAAFSRSPLVSPELTISRPFDAGRKINL